jgi:hypothetical protein
VVITCMERTRVESEGYGGYAYQALGALLLGPGAGQANSVVRPPFCTIRVFA